MHNLSSDLVRSALDSAPDSMVLIDPQGRIIFVNRQFSNVFGYDREEVRGQAVEFPVEIRRAANSSPTRQGSAPEILLVEDDPAVRDATRLLLKVEGYRVLTASCLTDARSLAKSHPDLDLLVTDYHLSATETGTQVISALRADLGRRLKAVLITGDTSAAMKELQQDRQLKLARKPIHADELLNLLKTRLAA